MLRNDDLLTIGCGPQGLKLHTRKFGYSPSMCCLYQISKKLDKFMRRKSLQVARISQVLVNPARLEKVAVEAQTPLHVALR